MECLDDTTIAQYVAHSDSAEARVHVERHIDACPTCRELVSQAAAGSGELLRPRDAREASLNVLTRGDLVGRYLVLGLLGRGGMAEVYVAHDPELNRQVALKIVRPDGGQGDQGARERLLREAQAMARLSHAHVVSIFDVGTFGVDVFLAMELVEGRDLSAWLSSEPRSAGAIVECFLEAGDGLAAAHASGLVHRDFKPQNVLVASDGRVKVGDFGLARVANEPTAPPRTGPFVGTPLATALGAPDAGASLTRTGALVGTLAYMAPEQLLGGATDGRTDQFAFCVALHQALAGRHPFAAPTPREMMGRVLAGTPDSSERVPRWLRRTLLRGLAVEPAARFPSMVALLAAIRAGRGRRRQAVVGLAAGAALSAALALGWGLSAREEPCGGSEAAAEAFWSAASRARLEASFAATHARDAADNASRVVRGLDDYARAWSAAHREACRATRVDGHQSEARLDARMTCLQRRGRAMQALAGVLARADAELVARAMTAVDALPDLATCASASIEEAGAAALTEQQRALAGALDARLAEADANLAAGRLNESATLARRTLDEATRAGLGATQARAWLARGLAEEALANLPGAVTSLESAFTVGLSARQDRVAARAAGYLIRVVGARQSKFEDSARWERLADASVKRLGGDPALAAFVQAQTAMVRVEAGQAQEGAQMLAEAVARSAQALGEAHPETTAVRSHYGIALWAADRHEESLAAHRVVLVAREHRYGPEHLEVASTLNNIGLVLWGQGKNAEALPYYQRALRIREARLPADHTDLANTLSNVGSVLKGLRRFGESEVAHRRALAIRERRLGSAHPDVAISLNNLGSTLHQAGRLDEAVEAHARALRIREQALPPDHPYTGMSLRHLATVERQRGRLDVSRAHFARLLPLWKRAKGVAAKDIAAVEKALREVSDALARSPRDTARDGPGNTPARAR